ncbi:MAG: hypothetical protein J7621_30570 [Niastella sp.]|nr:hypothetical protein [Niastella sp.]
MAKDALQSAWQQMPVERESSRAIKSMIQSGNHPVLKRIRRQLIIESAAFAALLAVYYDIFDGDRKPFIANVLLVAGLALSIVHNLIGYRLANSCLQGSTLIVSVQQQLTKLKQYAVLSVLSRGLAGGCLLFFFSMAITYTSSKYWILAGIVLFFAVQLFVLYRVWARRIGELQQVAGKLL